MTRLSQPRAWAAAAAVLALVLSVAGCKRGNQESTDPLGTSLIFDASPEAREALATPVDFRLTDANYAQWEQAQSNLDALPRSALPPASTGVGSAIDRAIARLESSPRARTAIERTGLSVRDFVLETIALAQATEAAETGKSTSTGPVPTENFQFVQRYRSRILRARAEARIARAQAETYYQQSDTAAQASGDTNFQMEAEHSEHEGEMRKERDSARTNDHAQEHDSVSRENNQPTKQNPAPARDTVRDTVPSRR